MFERLPIKLLQPLSTRLALGLTLGFSLLLGACSESTSPEEVNSKNPLQTLDESLERDTLTLAVLNQTIGFRIESFALLDKNDSLNVFRSLQSIWDEYQSNEPATRLQMQAEKFAELAPDVIALQEVMTFFKDGVADTDFSGDIVGLIEAAGGPTYQLHFEKVNDLSLQIQAYAGDSILNEVLTQDSLLDFRFYEGNALLIKEGIEIVEQSMDEFESVLKVPVLGAPFTSERNNTWALIKKDGYLWEVGSTHLEVSGFASFSKGQAGELLVASEARLVDSIPQVVAGDLNYPFNSGTHEILTSNGDFYDLNQFDPNWDPEDSTHVSCCQELISDTTSQSSLLDYILARNIVDGSVEYSLVGPKAISGNRTLWGADHSLVYGTLIAQR